MSDQVDMASVPDVLLKQLRELVENLTSELEEVNSVWEARVDELTAELESERARNRELEARLRNNLPF